MGELVFNLINTGRDSGDLDTSVFLIYGLGIIWYEFTSKARY